MRVLLDTSAYSALMRGDPTAADRVRRSDEVLVSTIVVGELLFGFRVGKRYQDNACQLDDFLDSPFVTLVQVTRTTADRFARIAAALRRKGRPIPVNDIWIAAQAMETGADLLSSDQHFEAVDGLALVRLSALGRNQ